MSAKRLKRSPKSAKMSHGLSRLRKRYREGLMKGSACPEYKVFLDAAANATCHYCDVQLYDRSYIPDGLGSRFQDSLTLDHKIARAAGGNSSLENLLFCCPICNELKGTDTYEEFVMFADKYIKPPRSDKLKLIASLMNTPHRFPALKMICKLRWESTKIS